MSGTGTSTLDFGAFPGAADASRAITGEAGIIAGSLVEAWIRPVATADHSADEHMLEPIKVIAGNIDPGNGFTIYGFNTNTLSEPPSQKNAKETRLYGEFTVAWVWN